MVSPKAFDPATAIPDLSSKVILITGGTAGLGAATLAHLAAHNPAHIIFTGRNEKAAAAVTARAAAAAPGVRVEFVPLDLQSLANARDQAKALRARLPRLDILILNAGIMAVPAATSADGYEVQFATNHLGHALLLAHLLPALRAAPDPRLVALTSQGYRNHPAAGIPLDALRGPGGPGWLDRWYRYGASKLATLLYAKELARRYPDVLALPVHPGVIADNGLVTALDWRSRLLVAATTWRVQISPELGGLNAAWAATVPRGEVENGGYYEPVGERVPEQGRGTDMALARKLWDWTEKELQPWM